MTSSALAPRPAPRSSAAHPCVLVAVPLDEELGRIVQVLAATGHVPIGVSAPELARALVALGGYDVVLADAELASEIFGPAGIARLGARIVLVGSDAVPRSALFGARRIARPILRQQLVGAIVESVAAQARLARTLRAPAASPPRASR